MTAAAPIPGGFDESEMYQILEEACAIAGLDSTGAQLLRGQTNAVIRLGREPVVVKIARRGSRIEDVSRTVQFVRELMSVGFPTVPLLDIDQPVIVGPHAATFWTYLPQPERPVDAAQLAKPLYALHTLTPRRLQLPKHDNIRAIRRSLSAITSVPVSALRFLQAQADRLEEELHGVAFVLPEGVIQGDPQHRNALHTADGGAVLCDWDTVAVGQPEWDLVTVEVHCRRFGYGQPHYQAFADTYGFDIVRWPGYATLAAIRELRMVTTNARKTGHAPGSLAEVERRIEGLRRRDTTLRWNLL